MIAKLFYIFYKSAPYLLVDYIMIIYASFENLDGISHKIHVRNGH